jgi:hypothetical protein
MIIYNKNYYNNHSKRSYSRFDISIFHKKKIIPMQV